MAEAIHPVMVGTAGHIDHGKSSLVRALTGVDPDRLKEEKERGLTIDLGFAPLVLSDGRIMGMIDVPGHERLVRNMVAGSTALDIAMLVVAADDGVMPQTREHLDVLDLVGVRCGLVALTKIDLVDPELVQLAASEIAELLASTQLAGARIVPVSTVTGAGIDELRRQLESLAAALEPRPHHGPFRMPIQRVFQLKGIGTVVTGIPVSGAIESGDTVEFLPGGHRSKVRALQAFGGKVTRAVAGHSTALSVPDARAAGLARGMVAAAPGVFAVGDAIDVELRLTQRARPLEHRTPVRFHSGTFEVQGLVLVLAGKQVERGDTVTARILLAEPACLAPGDRFLLRLQNPAVTVGGGVVLRVTETPKRYTRKQVAAELDRLRHAGAQIDARILEELSLAGPNGLTAGELAAGLGVPVDDVAPVLHELPEVHLHERGSRAFRTEVVDVGITRVFDSVERMLREKPLAASVMRSALRTSRELPPQLLDAVLDELARQGRARTTAQGRVLFAERLRPLGAADQQALDALVAATESAGFRPPTRAELAEQLGQSEHALEGLIARALDEGRIDDVAGHLYASATIRRALEAIHRNCLAHQGALEIPPLRDELGTSRKFLIPLLEYVDGLGLTRLRGGVRHLLPSSPLARSLAGAEGDPA